MKETLDAFTTVNDSLKKVMIALVSIVLLLIMAHVSSAANTATQTITFEVTAINEMAVSGNPAAMIINSATAGSAPAAVTDSSTTYDITTNETAKKITGQITTGGIMPSGVTLEANLTAPTGGTSAGYTNLSTTAADLVTSIATLAESTNTIEYRLSATIGAGVVASNTRVVTLTLSD